MAGRGKGNTFVIPIVVQIMPSKNSYPDRRPKKLTAIINRKNRYKNALQYEGHTILTGNSGLERVDVISGGRNGKRSVLVLYITEFDVILESCPEAHRFNKVLLVIGDEGGIGRLGTSCHLLKASPQACNGCIHRPVGT